MDLSAFYVQFKEETTENCRTIADGLLTLERMPGDRPALDGIFRAAHTVKGSARLLGFAGISQLAHALESLLSALRAGERAMTPDLNDVLLQANDALLACSIAASESRPAPIDSSALISRLELALSGAQPPAPHIDQPTAVPPAPAPGLSQPASLPAATTGPAAESVPAAAPGPATAAAPRPQRATVRVRVDRLDRLLTVSGELAVSQQEDSLHLDRLETLAVLAQQQQRTIQALFNDLSGLRLSPGQRRSINQRMHELQVRGSQLGSIARSQIEEYGRHAASRSLLVDELEAEIFAARLVPVATVLTTLPRAVRELARSLGKTVELEVQGEQTEADRKVLDALGEPLVHLVRNAIDHGLEPPDERQAAGKPPAGRLIVAAIAEHGQLRIDVRDDGRGMDPAKLRAIAVRKGLLEAQAAQVLSDAEAIDLIFLPGFSSSPIITDVSGRGVGMDVVRSRISELGGQVSISSTLGCGTTFSLALPISLMTTQVVLVEAGCQLWAFPSRSCVNLFRFDPAKMHQVEGQPLIKIDDRSVPVVRISDLLDLPADMMPVEMRQHVLLLGGNRPVALLVDRLVDEREVVIKSLGPLFLSHPVASGIAPLPDGTLAVVLSVQGLLNRLRSRSVRSLPTTTTTVRRSYRLLIVDDSFTTRELLRSILQSAGYDIITAVDGQDGLEKLRADPTIDLVVSDVEMPRLDGFGLTSSIRADQALTRLPVIIVTSLHSDEHKRQGIMAGAQAYIVKSQFDQSNLLAAIRDLLDE